jgi:hypothetical protein
VPALSVEVQEFLPWRIAEAEAQIMKRGSQCYGFAILAVAAVLESLKIKTRGI